MRQYEIFVFIICLAAIFSYVNHRFIKLPATIGMMLLSLISSLVLIFGAKLLPQKSEKFVAIITSIDFHSLLMNGMLSFLLFAGAIHIDANGLKKERLPIITMSTVGILISTFLIGTLLYFIFMAFNLDIGYIYCLLFAALISPTDPIAVLAILKQAGIEKSLELKIAGESLFNDGVAVVVFLTIMEVAQTGIDNLTMMDIGLLFVKEAGGGMLYGTILGYTGFWALRSIDKYEVEVLITIAIVMGGYLLADRLHISGPLAMVVAGIIIGNKGKESGFSDLTRDYVNKFWELLDEVLNALLFMLLGFEMLVLKIDGTLMIISLIMIVVVLLSRFISIALPITILRYKINFEKNAIAILTWGGLRGGLSVALALSLPQNMYRDQFVAITFVIVIFSIIVQGLTIGKLYHKLSGK